METKRAVAVCLVGQVIYGRCVYVNAPIRIGGSHLIKLCFQSATDRQSVDNYRVYNMVVI